MQIDAKVSGHPLAIARRRAVMRTRRYRLVDVKTLTRNRSDAIVWVDLHLLAICFRGIGVHPVFLDLDLPRIITGDAITK